MPHNRINSRVGITSNRQYLLPGANNSTGFKSSLSYQKNIPAKQNNFAAHRNPSSSSLFGNKVDPMRKLIKSTSQKEIGSIGSSLKVKK